MNSTTSTITVTYEDGTITLEKIVEEIKKRRFQVREQVEVSASGEKPSEQMDTVAPPLTPPAG